jgi:hypothetical protein
MAHHLSYTIIHPDKAMEWPYGLAALRLGANGDEILLTKKEVGELTIALNGVSAAMKAQAKPRPARGTVSAAEIAAVIARQIDGQS